MPRQITGLHPNIARRLLDARQRLLNTGLYLAHPTIRDKVEWIRDGKGHKLVVKNTKPVDDDAENLPPPEMAMVSLIAVISTNDFWMSSDAGWKGPTAFTKTLADAKASCTGEKPNVDTFGDDFVTAITNLQWFQDQIATHGFTVKKGALIGQPGAIPDTYKVKIRHSLFESLSDSKDGTEGAEEEEEIGDSENYPYTIENWPCTNDGAQEALESLKATHRVIPIPAYELEGGLMFPQYYRRQLQGAVVEMHFTLSHWSIAAKPGQRQENTDTYSAEVYSIRVLRPPLPTVVSPRKRKVSTRDPMDSSPTKKAKP